MNFLCRVNVTESLHISRKLERKNLIAGMLNITGSLFLFVAQIDCSQIVS